MSVGGYVYLSGRRCSTVDQRTHRSGSRLGLRASECHVPWLTVEPSAIGHGRTYALTSSLGYAVSPAMPLLRAAGATDVAGVPGVYGAAGTNGVVAANARQAACLWAAD